MGDGGGFRRTAKPGHRRGDCSARLWEFSAARIPSLGRTLNTFFSEKSTDGQRIATGSADGIIRSGIKNRPQVATLKGSGDWADRHRSPGGTRSSAAALCLGWDELISSTSRQVHLWRAWAGIGPPPGSGALIFVSGRS